MKQLLLFIIITIFFSFTVKGQDYTISGYVYDSETGERMIEAGVFDAISGLGTYTNEYGFYSLSLKSDSILLKVYYVGYEHWEKKLTISKSNKIDIALKPDFFLKEVIITDDKSGINTSPELLKLSPKDIEALPSLGGEKDFMKVMQMLPGISAGSDGSNSVFVRGGGDGQNLVLLDGVPVYNTNHLYGFLSVFNSNAISHLNIYKGGFPARYSGRLSSVIDVRMKEGNLNKYHGNVTLGIVASSFSFEGPIKKGKTSFMFSARRSLIDIFSRPLLDLYAIYEQNEDLRMSYYFYDFNLKFNHIINDKNRLYLSFYLGRDNLSSVQSFTFSEKFYIMNMKNHWGNATAVLRWNHVYGDKLFSNVNLYYSRFKSGDLYTEEYINMDNGLLADEIYNKFESRVESVSISADWDWRINPVNNIRFGINHQNLFFNPGINNNRYLSGGDLDPPSTPRTETIKIPEKFATDSYIYIEDNIRFKKLTANVGLNLSAYIIDNKLYPYLQPRLNIAYNFTDRLSVSASYSKMVQNIHMLTKNTMILSSDLWLPATKNIKPMHARQVAGGIGYNFNKGISARVDAYYKNMYNMIEYKDGASYIENQPEWENLVTVGDGNSYGFEFYLEKKTGRFSGWISYTLSWTNRIFEELNNGKEFPFKYDRRHNFSIVGIYSINEKINLSATWVYYTGTAYSLPESTYPVIYPDNTTGYSVIQKYSDKNAYRMPDYHRLDFSINFLKKKEKGTRTWSLGVYNLYNRKNPTYMNITHSREGKPILKQFSMFPLIPSISYSYKF